MLEELPEIMSHVLQCACCRTIIKNGQKTGLDSLDKYFWFPKWEGFRHNGHNIIYNIKIKRMNIWIIVDYNQSFFQINIGASWDSGEILFALS